MSCLDRLPTSGSMRSGCLYARPTWAPPIGGSGSSSSPPGGGWQTPTCEDGDGRDYTYPQGDHSRPFPTLAGEARDWPTPCAAEAVGRTQSEQAKAEGWQETLCGTAEAWPTPMTVNRTSAKAQAGRPTSGPQRGGPSFGLEDVAETWPMPTAHDAETPKTPEQIAAMREGAPPREGGGPPGVSNLNEAAAAWPTPRAQDSYERSNQKTVDRAAVGEAQMTLTRFVRGKWPTPAARDGDARGADPLRVGDPKRHGGSNLDDRAAGWPTPMTADTRRRGGNLGGNPMLVDAAESWPTPRTKTSGRDSGSARREAQGPNPGLLDAAADWPTPAARDSKGENSAEHCLVTGTGRKHMDQLPNFVAHAAPPPATDWSDCPLFRPAPATATPGPGSSPAGPSSPPPSPPPGVGPEMWKTPHGFQAGNGPDGNEFSKHVRKTEAAWVTPEARDWKGPQGQAAGGSLDLPAQAEAAGTWGTPMAGDASTTAGMRPSRLATGRKTEYLHRQVNSAKKKLNPMFTAWLMNWPPLWPIARTRCGSAGTAWYLLSARRLLCSSLVGSA